MVALNEVGMRIVQAIVVTAISVCGVTPAQDVPSFEVASIKPETSENYYLKPSIIKVDAQIGNFTNLSLADLVTYAFHVRPFQVIGPKGMSARFNVMAKLPDGAKPDQAPQMMMQLLVDRFQMKFHRESKEFSVYALITGPDGAKLTPAPADYVRSADKTQRLALSMDTYAQTVAQYFDKPVINETGLPGKYLIESRQNPFDSARLEQGLAQFRAAGNVAAGPPPARDPSGSPIFSILRELGLKVELRKEQLPVIVIDRIETNVTEQ
jgi:uncharacterized protein (TIGR03435 family)